MPLYIDCPQEKEDLKETVLEWNNKGYKKTKKWKINEYLFIAIFSNSYKLLFLKDKVLLHHASYLPVLAFSTTIWNLLGNFEYGKQRELLMLIRFLQWHDNSHDNSQLLGGKKLCWYLH